MSEDHNTKAIKAATVVVFGYGFSQFLRLLGNLILSRLLVPEYFGLMALSNILIQGLAFFSDVGLEPGIIRSKRAHEGDFLSTAWTIQVIRGCVIFLLSIVIAIPSSIIYNEPILAYIVPAIGLSSIFQGLQSTYLYTLSKELKQGILTYVEIIIQTISLVVIILLAYLYRNIWSLVIGSLVFAILKAIWSHHLTTGPKNHFLLEQTATTELLSFGKWIFFSSAMMFLASQADRLLLGKIFPLALLGIYNIALMFAELPKQVLIAISQRVLFPLITNFSHLSRLELRTQLRKQRRIMLYPLGLLVAVFACFGDYLILLLYDQRYQQASWILPLLAAGIWPLVLHSTIDRSLYALGKPNYSAFGNLAKFLYMLVALPMLHRIAGNFGAVIAVVMNDIPVYIIINIGLVKEKISLLKQDLVATLAFVVMIGFFLALRQILCLGFPGEEAFLVMMNSR